MDAINSKEQFSQSYGSLGVKQGGVEYAKAMDSLGGYIPDLGNSGTNTQGLTTNYVDADIASPNFKTGVSGWQIRQDGSAEFQNISIGQKIITIDTSGSISGAITALGSSGGTIFLKPGTYTVTTAVAIPSNVTIQGQSPSGTIINFNSTAANFTMTGSSVYNTGTITSITSGTAVVGSGTSWLANVTAGSSQLFINDRWYAIASVADNTHLTLSESYAGPTVGAGTSYRIAIPIRDSKLINLTLKSSTGTSFVVTDARDLSIEDVFFLTSSTGFSFSNVSESILNTVVCSGHTSDGYQFTKVGFTNAQYLASIGNGGNGATFNDVRTMNFLASAADSNTGDGYNITSGVDVTMQIEASNNGSQGVEMVATCSNVALVGGLFDSNVSDGIKLTASSDNCRVDTGKITNNGGYGINIANANCDNNLILAPYFASNTSGDVNDGGTGTIRIQQGALATFGGTGADGALSISSGTTTINLGGANVFTKNYTSISITGTGALAFSNPHASGTNILLKSQGAVTITSSTNPAIDVSSLGSAAGSGGAQIGGIGTGAPSGGGGASSTTSGSAGTNGNGVGTPTDGTAGTNAVGFLTNTGGGAGSVHVKGAAGVSIGLNSNYANLYKGYFIPGSGGGGGSGGSPSGAGGNGGRGGGALYIECKGALNVTSTLTAAGANGSNGQTNGGGGGGGGGGSIVILYNTLTANSGTFTVTGGSGGTGFTTGGAGATGYSAIVANTEFN